MLTPDGPPAIEGVVDVVNDEFLGVRSASGLHRIAAEGDAGCGVSAYHYSYGRPVDVPALTAQWQDSPDSSPREARRGDVRLGASVHLDLTVPDAPGLRDLCTGVVGWTPEPLGDDQAVPDKPRPRGLRTQAAPGCITKTIEQDRQGAASDARRSPATVARLRGRARPGGESRRGEGARRRGGGRPKCEGPGSYAVIRDPAGAVLALMVPAT